MINLFDNYSKETRDLHESLKKSGFQHPTIVIEPNGFLPDDVISPYMYFLNNKKDVERGCFFNEVKVPDFWEILGDGSSATVKNYEKVQARINYSKATNNRIVESVEWLDDDSNIYQIDHYDKYGNVFAKTTVDKEGKYLISTYFDNNKDEKLVENHVTGDLILTLENEPMFIFHNRVEFVNFFLRYLEFDKSTIFYNTLANSFLVSHYSTEPGKDLLFWQEPIGDEIPGNMALILNNENHRTKKIVVPNKDTYEKIKSLLPDHQKDKIVSLGYVYDFKRSNNSRKDAFIFTNSDQIEHLETLVQNLPEVTFRVAARTEMSPKLMSMVKYPNIVLYQNIDKERIDYIFETSDILLDINYYTEVMSSTRRAFENNMLVLGFSQTIHNDRYIAKDLIFDKDDVMQMISTIQDILLNKELLENYLIKQQRQGNSLSVEEFRFIFEQTLGEL